MKSLKNMLMLALVSMLVACGGNKDAKTDKNASSSIEKIAEKGSSKPIEIYKNIIADVEKLGLKSKKVNLTSGDKILQLMFYDASNKVTNVTVQINYCEKPAMCYKATGLKEFTNTYKDRGASISEKSGIYDSKIKEEDIAGKAVYVNLSHYKQKPAYNSYRANYLEGKYMVEVYIAGKYNTMTDDYKVEQELGKAVLEATLKVKPE